MIFEDKHLITFFQHNFEDVNTFYMKCTSCESVIRRPVHSIGLRISINVQQVKCRVCGKTHRFNVSQMCLTYVFKFFPDQPMVKSIGITYSPYNIPFQRNTVTLDINATPEHTQDQAIAFFTTNAELLKLLDQ
jgi:hypothetical protein